MTATLLKSTSAQVSRRRSPSRIPVSSATVTIEHSALFLDAPPARLEQPRLFIRLQLPQAPLWLTLETDRRHPREHFPLVAGQPEQIAQ